ncbi:hypothetical protein N2605_23210 [Bradyrhizobium yuanmingense]|uniref:hypothetical protein n=1 Tax=Bradyrhizobium yuanmingense TaxID=108015 RepID=UPI0021A9140B|nr:hypothetical protein [Bradyrhizobium sp. CB1024]UWU82509.1 hypothetical protein N2605_23210 [Bradyrhizobium sp. CB1024]
MSNRICCTDAAEVAELSEGFLARTLPGARFSHREHLIVTSYLLATDPARDWRVELPEMIRAYNVAAGGVNDDVRGYHHTITMAFLMIIEGILAEVGRRDIVAACNAVLASPATEKDVLLRFWSREALFSREARHGWIEPDLAEFKPRASGHMPA